MRPAGMLNKDDDADIGIRKLKSDLFLRAIITAFLKGVGFESL